MDERKKLKKGILIRDEFIAAEREQEAIILANLGQSVYNSGSADKKPLNKYQKPIGEISDEIHNLEDSLRRLLADDEKRTVAREETKALKVELRNIKNKEEPLFEELGRSSWELWKSGRSVHENFEEALDDLIKAELRLHAAEDAVIRTEQDSGSKAAKLLIKGKALLLAGRRKTASTTLDRMWGRAGEKLFKVIPAASFSNTPAALPSSSLEALSKRRDEISRRESELNDEVSAMDRALEDMPGKGGVKRRVSWIETRLETINNNLDDAFRTLGKVWVDQSGKKSSDAVVEKWKKELAEVNKRISVLEVEQNTISAHMEFLEAEEERDAKAGQVSKLEEEVKSRQSVLKGLKKELSAMEKKLADEREKLPVLPEDR